MTWQVHGSDQGTAGAVVLQFLIPCSGCCAGHYPKQGRRAASIICGHSRNSPRDKQGQFHDKTSLTQKSVAVYHHDDCGFGGKLTLLIRGTAERISQLNGGGVRQRGTRELNLAREEKGRDRPSLGKLREADTLPSISPQGRYTQQDASPVSCTQRQVSCEMHRKKKTVLDKDSVSAKEH